MFIYVYRPGDPPAGTFPVEPETTLGELKQVVASAFFTEAASVTLSKDGQALSGDEKSLASLGLRNKDLVHIS